MIARQELMNAQMRSLRALDAREKELLDRRMQAEMQKLVMLNDSAMNAAVKHNPVQRFDPNKSEAFQIPLSQLVTMWRMRYGDVWFDGIQPASESPDFYDDALKRLKAAKMFEECDGWYRLREDAA